MNKTENQIPPVRKGLIRLCSSGLLSLGLSVGITEAVAANNGYSAQFCPQSLNIPARPTVDAVLGVGDTHLVADKADLVEEGVSILTGNAEITQNRQQVRADIIKYYQDSDTAELEGNVHYWDEKHFLHSKDAFLTFDNGVGEFTTADYILIDEHGRGTAEKLVLDIGTRTDMEQADYTTCNPGEEFWNITAKSATLDYETERGSAWHVVLKIKKIPVFYSPYLSFPLSDARKSGFLSPSYGSTNRHGIELRTPYYWNISPNMDATLTPRILADSGVMVMGEYRFLHHTGSGIIKAEYLPSDKQRETQRRYLFGIKLDQKIGGKGRLNLNYNKVSDKFYFEDFGNQLSITSTRFLDQKASFIYSGTNWKITTSVQNYQTVDRSISVSGKPYKKLPQINFNYKSPRKGNAFNYGFSGEATYFKRDDFDSPRNVNNNVNGLRFDFSPYISYRASTRGTFIEPKLRFRYTQYTLDNNQRFESSSPNRFLPIFSLDSGLFLERNIRLFNEELLQTLEPRLYYLYVPKTDQSDLPVFDTGRYTFSFGSLFREDRFNNPDRIGDANRITLAITSNHISSSQNRNLGYIRVGQIFYLDDRRVSLSNTAKEEDSLSPLVAQVGLFPLKDLRILNDFQWDPNGSGTQKLTTSIRYNPEPRKIIDLAYRDHGGVDQSAISFRLPIVKNLSAVGHWTYAIPQGRSLETFVGIEYDSCCWSMRAVARRFLTNIDREYETGFFLQLELKGLAGVGRKTVNFLKKKIPGYHEF